MSPKWHKYQWMAEMLILNFLQFCKSNRKIIFYAGKYSTYITWGTYIAQGFLSRSYSNKLGIKIHFER